MKVLLIFCIFEAIYAPGVKPQDATPEQTHPGRLVSREVTEVDDVDACANLAAASSLLLIGTGHVARYGCVPKGVAKLTIVPKEKPQAPRVPGLAS